MNDDAITSFRIGAPEQDLADLAARLDRTRWPGDLPGDGWGYGVALQRVRGLAAYWRDRFDWRAAEARLNQFPQFTTVIEGSASTSSTCFRHPTCSSATCESSSASCGERAIAHRPRPQGA